MQTPAPGESGRRGIDQLPSRIVPSHTLPEIAVQHRDRDLDGDAVRERQAIALASRLGLTINAARLVAELAFDPGRRR